MHYSYSYVSDSEEGLLAMLLVYGLQAIISCGVGIALYVFRSLGVYSIAKRRGLNHPWFAWVPVVDQYLLGCLSDQFQYVVKGKNKSKRKWLLGLNIALFVLYALVVFLVVRMIIQLYGNAMLGFNEAKLASMAIQWGMSILGTFVPVAAVSIAMTVVRYVALYDVYVSLEPRNSVLYTVLSILFNVTEPFFLFFNRKKDDGMPPRRDAPAPGPHVWDSPAPEPPVWDSPASGPEQPWVNE